MQGEDEFYWPEAFFARKSNSRGLPFGVSLPAFIMVPDDRELGRYRVRLLEDLSDRITIVSSEGSISLHPEKMETKKYDPTIRKHVAYKEAKIK